MKTTLVSGDAYSPYLGSSEGLFDFFEHIRVSRPELGFTRESVVRMYRGAAEELGIDLLKDCPYDLWPSRSTIGGGVMATSTSDSGAENVLESSHLAPEAR